MCSQMIRAYSKDSFDRFGDDLSQLILSYLSISDCFGLQCVSKQFKALIFNKQTRLVLSDGIPYFNQRFYRPLFLTPTEIVIKDLVINYGFKNYYLSSNKRLLKYVINKCVNINHIIIDCDFVICDRTVNIIIDSLKHLKHLSICKSQTSSETLLNCWKRFAENSLQNVESLTIYKEIDTAIIASLILLCPKLKRIHNSKIKIYFDRCFDLKEDFGANIQSVSRYLADNERSFQIFTDHFKYRLKSLSVYFRSKTELMKYLVEFENLEYLCCGFSFQSDCNAIELLKLIGLKCLRLRVLKIADMTAPLNEVFRSGFQSLEKLSLKFYSNCESFEFLKKCSKLTHLKLSNYCTRGTEFNDIHLYLPQLESIDICIDYYQTKLDFLNTLKQLDRLPNLFELKVCGSKLSDKDNDNCDTITNNVISFIEKCSTIKRIVIYPEDANINKTMIEEYIESNNRKIDFKTAKRKLD